MKKIIIIIQISTPWKKYEGSTGNEQLTFLDIGCPIGSGRTVTKLLSASSKTVADTVVLIGTPSLLLFRK